MSDKAKNTTAETTATNTGPEFAIQRIYAKDISFETPNSPEIFKTEEQPAVGLEINSSAYKLADDVHEVVLKLTVTTKVKDKTAFLVELHQAGIFTLKGFNQEQLKHMLASFCPNILFPYAREAISDLVSRGSFPPLYLAPINFDALYHQHLEKEKQKNTH
jgi:preprotein translocase subunit SecB